ncbi:MAG: thiamine pyrophosphate-dependent enzyme [Thermoplasmata archaeon]
MDEKKETRRTLMMGNEAIARGALEARINLLAAYPGTPASEIGEYLSAWAKEHNFYAEWSVNEKVSFDVAVGASIAGARALVPLKNAGFNWIMDMFMTIPYGGIKGGLVIASADDPSAHYSSNEQDTRFLAKYAEVLCLEPSNQQDAKDYTKWAFEASEILELPVVLRTVTRISHASGDVELEKIESIEKKDSNSTVGRLGLSTRLGFNKHYKMPFRWNVYGPPGAVEKHRWQKERLEEVKKLANECKFNILKLAKEKKEKKTRLGIIASGIGFAYTMEALKLLNKDEDCNILKIATPFPIPTEKVKEIIEKSSKIVVVEEGEPVVESQVREFAQMEKLKVDIFGKMSSEKLKNVFPKIGELNTEIVINGLANKQILNITTLPLGFDLAKPLVKPSVKSSASTSTTKTESADHARAMLEKLVIPRSSTLCAGCPHLGTYFGLRKALEENRKKTGKGWIINGDIGCYEQGGYGVFSQKIEVSNENEKFYPIKSVYEILDTNYIMGGGIGLAQGQARAGLNLNIVAVAGDSTFFHACLPALVNAVQNKTKVLFVVMDNRWTCMTGHQPSPTTGINALGENAPVLNIEEICQAMKVPKIFVSDAYNIQNLKENISKALEYADGPSVVISKRECMLQVLRREKRKCTTKVNEKCTGCKMCISLGCPAIMFDTNTKKASIDKTQCVDCGICKQICEKNAIEDERDAKITESKCDVKVVG